MQPKPLFSKLGNLTLVVMLVLSVFAAALPQFPAAAAPTVECDETYTVKDGETIYRVARNHDVSVNKLAKANNLTSPYYLTAGQKLCIPEIPEVSSKIKWSASYSNDRVEVTGDGFKKDRLIFVKVRETDTSAWYKLGATETDRDGELDDSFRLPKDLRGKASVMVCLKDGVSDALTCKKVYRQ